MTGDPLDAVFRPRSVAVIGASSDPTKRGHQAVRALRESGYDGDVYLVNPRGGTLFGLTVFEDPGDLPEVPELALVCTPAGTVPEILERCGALGVGAAIVVAVGFGESDAEGEELERRIREVAARTGIRVVGPNTSGVLNRHTGLNLMGARGVPAGDLALLVQSGNVGLSLMTEVGSWEGRGVSVGVGVGNEAGVAFHEYLEWMGRDPDTRGILVYAEGIGEPRRFLDSAARVGRTKPIVLLAGGRSDEGRRAARSHTGAVGGAHALFRAGLRQAGVVRVERSDELLPVAWTVTGQPAAPPGRRVAILSDGGGQGTLATDTLVEAGLGLADLAEGTRAALRELLGRAAAVGNPVDLAGAADADPEVFGRALGILASDGAVGAVLVVGLFGGYHIRFAEELAEGEARAAAAMARTAEEAGIGLVVHSMYASHRPEPLTVLARAGIPVIGSLDVACRCVGALVERGLSLERAVWCGEAWERMGSVPPDLAVDDAGVPEVLGRCRAEGREALSEHEARTVVRAFGVPMVPGTLCRSPDEVRRAALELSGSLVLKVVSPRIPHKTEAGGVVTGLYGDEPAAAAYSQIVERARAYLADVDGAGDPDGVLVSPLLDDPVAELLVGVRRDLRYGPVCTVGAGGIAVEVLGDVAHRVLPVGRDEVLEMLDELRIAPLLRGVRGRPGVDAGAVADVVLALARCLRALPELEELEVNPLFAYPDRAVAVDVAAFLGEPDPTAASSSAESDRTTGVPP